MNLGERLRIIRESKGLTQDVLAERAGLTNISISAIETGRVSAPRIKTIVAIAKSLNVSLDAIVKDVEF